MNFQNAAYLVERAPTCSYGPRKVLVVTLSKNKGEKDSHVLEVASLSDDVP